MDAELWKLENYPAFLEARRVLLADAANAFLGGLRSGPSLPSEARQDVAEWARPVAFLTKEAAVDETDADGRGAEVDELIAWLADEGYSHPQVNVEVVDPDSGRVLAVAEAFWPNGLQEGMGQPVVLELDPDALDEEAVQALG